MQCVWWGKNGVVVGVDVLVLCIRTNNGENTQFSSCTNKCDDAQCTRIQTINVSQHYQHLCLSL